jgi:hypothetical protein
MSTITYRFFPAVDSANGMPRKTEFPYESVDPFTVPSCSFKLTLADPFAAASGIGLPLTRGTCPTKRPNERLWRAIIKAAGVLIVVNREWMVDERLIDSGRQIAIYDTNSPCSHVEAASAGNCSIIPFALQCC